MLEEYKTNPRAAFYPGLFTGQNPTGGSGLEVFEFPQDGSGRVESGRVGSGRVGSGLVGSGRVGSGRVGSSRVGSAQVGSGRVRSGRVKSGQVGSGRAGRVESEFLKNLPTPPHPTLAETGREFFKPPGPTRPGPYDFEAS